MGIRVRRDPREAQPPATLRTFTGSIVRGKMHYALLLLRWTQSWLSEVQGMDLDAALDGLALAKRLRRTASDVENSFAEAAIAEMIDQGQHVHHGEGYTALLHPAHDRRKWNHESLLNELIDIELRRQQHNHPEIPARALRQIVSETIWRTHAVARLEWRSTDLRRRGIHPDDFSDVVPVPASLELSGQASYSERRTHHDRRQSA